MGGIGGKPFSDVLRPKGHASEPWRFQVLMLSVHSTEDGNALTGRLFGGKGSATVVGFYDAAAKQIKWLWVNSGGAVDQALISMKDGKWTFQSTGSLADGTKTESTSTVTISDNGNMHTWTGSGQVGDKKTDDQHDVWRRVNR